MHTPQSTPHDQEVVEVVELRGVAALAWIQGEAKALIMEEALSLFVDNWSDDRQFVLYEFETEPVLLDDLLIAPAFWTVEFDDQRVAVLYPDLVDPVFITVQGKSPAVAKDVTAFDGIHDETGCQGFEWVLG